MTKKSYKLSKTYAEITPESASRGDFDETGFIYQDKKFNDLQEIIDEILSEGYVEPSSSVFHKDIWYTSSDPEIDYRSGRETYYSFHLKGFTTEEQKAVYLVVTGVK